MTSKFVLFQYDPMIGVQTPITASSIEQELIEYITNENTSLYYCIYKYNCDTFHFCGKMKARTYSLHKKVMGKKNTGMFPFSPYDVAHKFDGEYSWYYQTA